MIPESVQDHLSHLCVTVWLKPFVFFRHAHRHKQQQVAMGKATRASDSRKGKCSSAVAVKGKCSSADADEGKCSSAVADKEPECFKGWTIATEFLRQDCKEQRTELVHVISCSELMDGVQAEVNWYTGGNSYVTLPKTAAAKRPGVYLVKANHIQWMDLSDEDQGPQTPSASITHLRWLGTRSQFVKVADARGVELGKKKVGLLTEMLNVNVDSSDTMSGDDESEPQSRHGTII